MAEKKTTHHADNEAGKADTGPKPGNGADEPLHARAPETVDTSKDRERADALRREQEALLTKQDKEVREEQKKQDEKDKA